MEKTLIVTWWEEFLRWMGIGRPRQPERPAAKAIPLPRPPEPQKQAAAGPGFSATAGDQIRPARTAGLDRARARLRDILTPSQPVVDLRAFAGRKQTLERLISAIEDQRLHVVLYGSRGMGKTSLLHVISQRAREARYHVFYGSCGIGTQFGDLFRSILSDIPLRFHTDFAGGQAEGGRVRSLAESLPDGDLTPRQVSDVLSKLTGTRIIIIIDEFDRSDPGEFRQSVADLIKSLSDRAARVQLLIAGVGSNLSELIEHIPSIQRNILGMQIPPMSAGEVNELLDIARQQIGLTFADEAASLITATAQGWPYAASLISHHAGLAALRRGTLDVSQEDVVTAIGEAAEEVGGRLPSTAIREIDYARAKIGDSSLASAAMTHIVCGGEFTARNLAAVTEAESTTAACTAAIDQLASEGILLEARQDRFGKSYQFLDIAVPLYLWLATARDAYRGPGVASTDCSSVQAHEA